MATLTGKQLKDSYQGLLTIKTADNANPLSGRLENGLGNAITNLGIGTDSPQSNVKLQIEGTDGASGSSANIAGNEFFIDNNGNTGMTIGSSNTGTGYYAFADSDVALRAGIFYDHTSDFMGFRVSSAERMRIDSSGNVEINGSAAPLLSVKSTASGTPTAFVYASTNGADFGSLTNHPTKFYVNNDEKMRIDSSGNVGIGETNPTAPLQIKTATSAGNAKVAQFLTHADTTSGTEVRLAFAAHTNIDVATDRYSYISALNTSGSNGQALVFATNAAGAGGSEAMRIDSSGRVGINHTPNSSYSRLQIKTLDSGYSLDLIGRTAGTEGETQITFWNSAQTVNQGYIVQDNGNMIFGTGLGASDSMKIDSSGNVLVGKTSASKDTVGAEMKSDGRINATMTSGSPILANRLSTDGDIATFQKDGTTVGSIGSTSGVVSHIVLDPRSGAKGAGIMGASIDANTGIIQPTDKTGAVADNEINLGNTTVRWKNLYLGGSVYLGGTDSANALDDYEEGTWTPAYEMSGTDFTSVTYDTGFTAGKYTKVGDLVHIQGALMTDAITAGSASGVLTISGIPFAIGSSTNGRDGFISGSIGVATDFAGDHPVTLYAGANTTEIIPMTRNSANGATANLVVGDLDTGANKNLIYFSATYKS